MARRKADAFPHSPIAISLGGGLRSSVTMAARRGRAVGALRLPPIPSRPGEERGGEAASDGSDNTPLTVPADRDTLQVEVGPAVR